MARFRAPLTESLEARRHFAAHTALYPYSFGGPGFDNVQKAITTTAGDTILTGLFSGTVNFDRGGSKAGLRTARGDTDIYVAEYNAAGTLQWVTQIGGDFKSRQLKDFNKRDLPINQQRLSLFTGKIGDQPRGAGEYVNDIAADAAGNVYLAGAFAQTILAGKISLTADQTFTQDFYDGLVVKISSTGNVTWARQISGPFDDDAMTVALDASGTPIVGGYFQRQARFRTTTGTKLFNSSDGRDCGYVIRMDASTGNVAWEYQFESRETGTDERNAVNGIVVTPSGEVYLDGTFADRTDFDPSSARYVLKADGKTDAFLAKLDRHGKFQWALATGGKSYDGNSAITMDPQGNIYTAGYFSDEVDVNPLTNVTTTFKATPEPGHKKGTFPDVLISKFSADGTPIWQDQMGGSFQEIVSGIAFDPQGGVVTTGSFFNTADFDPGKGVFDLSSTLVLNGDSIKDKNNTFGRNETYDGFVSVLSPRGKFVNAIRLGGQDDDYLSGVSIASDGNIFVTGRATAARGDRKTRNEQALIYLLDPELKIL